MKCHIHIAILLACCLLMTVPAFGHGNIYLTGHDLDFHCALQPLPTSCNAFKIAVLFAVAGAPDKTKHVLFLDQNTAPGQLATAATNAGLTAAGITWDVVDPTSATFTGHCDGCTPLALTGVSGAPNYSAIVFASDYTCGGCDNDVNGENAINARSGAIANFFLAGGGLVYLSAGENFVCADEGCTHFTDTGSWARYYNSVPSAYGVAGMRTSLDGVNPQANGCLTNTLTGPCYQLTAAGIALGLNNNDANCCFTHNSFSLFEGNQLTIAETDPVVSESGGNPITLYASDAPPGSQAAVLTFTPGNNVSRTGLFNCGAAAPPCPNANANSMKFTFTTVKKTFTVVLSATEVSPSGTCTIPPSGNANDDTTNFGCRLANFFADQKPIGNYTIHPYLFPPNTLLNVPSCVPYSNGNCVFYRIQNPPNNTNSQFYTGDINFYIAWNSAITPPAGYANNPQMYDDPSNDQDAADYPSTPGFPYTPEDHQFVFNVTTYFNPNGQAGLGDPGVGGRGRTPNDWVIAFPLASPDNAQLVVPFAMPNPAIYLAGFPMPVVFTLENKTSDVSDPSALTRPNYVNAAVLDSTGVRQSVQTFPGAPKTFKYTSRSPFNDDPLYYIFLDPSLYTLNKVYQLQVQSNLFDAPLTKNFKVCTLQMVVQGTCK